LESVLLPVLLVYCVAVVAPHFDIKTCALINCILASYDHQEQISTILWYGRIHFLTLLTALLGTLPELYLHQNCPCSCFGLDVSWTSENAVKSIAGTGRVLVLGYLHVYNYGRTSTDDACCQQLHTHRSRTSIIVLSFHTDLVIDFLHLVEFWSFTLFQLSTICSIPSGIIVT
jgi:hypothetical protein